MKDLLLKNLGWKILSLAVALLLWATLVGEQQLSTATSVPIILRNVPADLEISSDVPDRVHIEIQGPAARLSQLPHPAVTLDLSQVSHPGERTFTIRQSNLNLPPGVRFVRSVPAQLRIRFERRVSRRVPVQIRIGSPPPPGYRIVRQEAHPDTVSVAGPESRVNRVEYAETDSIDVSAQVGEREYPVSAYLADQHVRITDAPRVAVRIVVEKQGK